MAAFWLRETEESLPSRAITEECSGEWNWSSSPMPDQCSPPDEAEAPVEPDDPAPGEADEAGEADEPAGGELDRPEPAPVVAPAMAWAPTANWCWAVSNFSPAFSSRPSWRSNLSLSKRKTDTAALLSAPLWAHACNSNEKQSNKRIRTRQGIRPVRGRMPAVTGDRRRGRPLLGGVWRLPLQCRHTFSLHGLRRMSRPKLRQCVAAVLMSTVVRETPSNAFQPQSTVGESLLRVGGDLTADSVRLEV